MPQSFPVAVLSLALLGLMAGLVCSALGDDLAPGGNLTPSGDAFDKPQRIIVLNTGRVIYGDLVDRPGGYLIRDATGSTVIPFTQVRLTAIDLQDAYRKLRDSITKPTASAHLSLAQWCFENRLYDSSRMQVKQALLLEPERKSARSLLLMIERVTTGDAFDGLTPPTMVRHRDGFAKTETEALHGSSRETTREFVRKVQVLLLNKCGDARCHGIAAENDFKLTRARRGSSGFRAYTDQNLAAVLRFIDPEFPRASPLLTKPHGEHGGQPAIFTGPRADEQQSDLRAWVARVALEHRSSGKLASTTVSGVMVDEAGSTTPKSSAKRDPFLREVLAEERPDNFDPAIFNRLMHGRD